MCSVKCIMLIHIFYDVHNCFQTSAVNLILKYTNVLCNRAIPFFRINVLTYKILGFGSVLELVNSLCELCKQFT